MSKKTEQGPPRAFISGPGGLGGANGSTTGLAGDPDLDASVHGIILFTIHKDDEGKPHLMWSRDGVTFEDPIGDVLFDFGASSRDPSMLHWDNAFWVAHTGPSDLEKFTVWRSDRLLTGWAQLVQPDCSATSPFRVWAPEWFIDPADDSIHVFIAMAATDFDDFTLYEIHPTDREMTTWSAPAAVTGSGFHTNMIDPYPVYTTIYGDPDKPYKLFYKQERTEGPGVALAESASLTSGYTVIETDDWAGWVAGVGGDSIEGFSILELDDGRWRAYFTQNDGFSTVAHWYSDSVDDWATWSAPVETVWPWVPGHGSPLRVPSTIDLARALVLSGSSLTPATTVEDETTWGITPAVGTDLEYARQDHTHGTPDEPTGGGVGPILLASDHAVPFTFDEILQASDGSDFLYASE